VLIALLGPIKAYFDDATPIDIGGPRSRMLLARLALEAVLMLDNCEHLVEAAAELADRLLDRLPHLRILATSREPLAITGEALCHLDPLEVPTGAPELAEAAAVRLFIDRAAGVRPGFALDDSTVDTVAEICCRLDGMPLALELAAAKLRSMSVDQIARRLSDRLGDDRQSAKPALAHRRSGRLAQDSYDTQRIADLFEVPRGL
jgi:predicted ATPase